MVELNNGERGRKQLGQAMVEYALILVLLALALGTALALTGPAIGNVFCNVVSNIGGDTASPQGGECGSTAPNLVALGGEPTRFWSTVTWVAAHPQRETPFPTPIRRAPANSGAVVPPTNTPSNTPSFTPTFTPTNTPTATKTFTPGPSPTNGDFAFTVPHDDQINNPEWWRLDSGDFTGYANWAVQWYDNMNTTPNAGGWLNINLSGSVGFNNALSTDINGIQYDWGSGVGDPSIACCSTWGGDFTRIITVAQTATYKFTLDANNFANVAVSGVNGNNPIVYRTSSGTSTQTMVIPAGTHTLQIKYAQNSGTARLHLNIDRLTVNPDDTVVGNNSCTWGRSGGSNNPVSVTYMFDENPASDSWTSGQTCYLELRGYIDLTGKAHPIFSYWDIWDFLNAGSSGFSAQLQVSRYVKDVNGFLDRSQLSWHTIASTVRNAGTRNYNWTRTQVDLSSLSSFSDLVNSSSASGIVDNVTFRFVIGSSSPGAAPFRWYIDDIQVVNDAAPATTFTIDNSWDMNLISEMSDFIYDGDSYDNPAVTNPISPRRWGLSSTHAHSGMSWDDSPGANYQDITGLSPASPTGVAQARIHFLQFKYPINLTSSAPAQDAEHDTGDPILTFWNAFDIAQNASIRVQYYDATGGWTDIPNQGVLINYTVPTGTSRTNLTMQPVEIDLMNIPAANRAAPVKLRFALYVDAAASSFGDGWYIDDIRFQRESSSPYFSYPFIDDAEDSIFTGASWDVIGGKWGVTSTKGGAEGTSKAYTDSPGGSGLYDANDSQQLQLHFAIDLLHDTPANTTHPSDHAAINPKLTFWHQRNLGPGAVFSVDMWTPITGTWQSIWQFDSDTTAPSFDTQRSWERAEIDLATAVSTVESKLWSNITGNGDNVFDDDDIKIRFNFTSGSGAVADGVYVDQIRIQDASTATHRLWAGGDGEYLDSVETASPALGTWQSRWYTGGKWGATGGTGFTHTGSQSLTDSPGLNYADNTYSVLELVPIIDMTDPSVPANPMLSFWTRFQVGADDNVVVQISRQDASDSVQGYDKMGGWSAWTTMPLMAGVPAPGNQLTNTEVDTWVRGQVDLSSFVSNKIRVRFVVSVPNTTTQADGIYIDDVKFSYTNRLISLPMIDNAQATTNWVTEGNWGLGQDYFLGNGTNDLGLSTWFGTYFDCEQLKQPAESCTDAATYTRILKDNVNLDPVSDSFRSTGPRIGPENVTTGIEFNWGSIHRPLNDAAQIGTYGSPGYDDSFAARWTRTVTLQPGTTYSFYTISDDGVRLTIDNMCGTTIAADVLGGANAANCPVAQKGIIIERWGGHPATLDYVTFTVTSATQINRTLTLEYFEGIGDAEMILNATSSSFSFTDSPNTPSATGFDLVGSTYPGNSSLMLNGYFNLSASAAPFLEYKRLYDLRQNTTFYVEVSTDGGFTWSQINSETVTNTVVLPPNNFWEQRHIDLRPIATAPNNYIKPNVMIRFRLDTRTASLATGGVGDGVYLADINMSGS